MGNSKKPNVTRRTFLKGTGVALALISLGAQFVSMNGTFNLGALQNLTAIDGFYGMIRIDGFAIVFKAIFLIAAALAILIAMRYLDIEREQHGEYYALTGTLAVRSSLPQLTHAPFTPRKIAFQIQ